MFCDWKHPPFFLQSHHMLIRNLIPSTLYDTVVQRQQLLLGKCDSGNTA